MSVGGEANEKKSIARCVLGLTCFKCKFYGFAGFGRNKSVAVYRRRCRKLGPMRVLVSASTNTFKNTSFEFQQPSERATEQAASRDHLRAK